jgi:hypothetical protein
MPQLRVNQLLLHGMQLCEIQNVGFPRKGTAAPNRREADTDRQS